MTPGNDIASPPGPSTADAAGTPRWLTLGEASTYLGVAQGTVRRWADAGTLPTFRTPGGHRRFRQGDLDSFMRNSGSAPAPTSRHGGRPEVLVVDDDAGVRALMTELLQAEDFEVRSASDARSGLLAINEKMPDLLLLDVNMPSMDGWQMLRLIRSKLDVADLPVIVFSGVVSRRELRSAPGRGAQGWLRKPFDPHRLVAQAKALLSSNAAAE